LARRHGISEATLYNWKAKSSGMDIPEARRPKALEDENAKLKKLLAEQVLDAAGLRELLSKIERNAILRRRRCAGQDRGVGRRSQRRAPAFVPELSHSCGLRRHIHRNGRSATQPRPVPPIAHCSTHAERRTKTRDSNSRWMKVQWQVRGNRRVTGRANIKLNEWFPFTKWGNFVGYHRSCIFEAM
jgi:hypothetical protein